MQKSTETESANGEGEETEQVSDTDARNMRANANRRESSEDSTIETGAAPDASRMIRSSALRCGVDSGATATENEGGGDGESMHLPGWRRRNSLIREEERRRRNSLIPEEEEEEEGGIR
jgi:hypothetical protein